MKSAALVFPHQLFKSVNELKRFSDIFFVEEALFFNQYNFHIQKLIFHRASMKAYEKSLKKLGIRTHYIESVDERSDIRKLIQWLKQNDFIKAWTYEPADDWLSSRVRNSCSRLGIELKISPTPSFITPDHTADEFFEERKKYHQSDFYIFQRKRLEILLDTSGKPTGGKWSYDAENRMKYPQNVTPAEVQFPDRNEFIEEAEKYVFEKFPHNPGDKNIKQRYPVTRKEAEEWLWNFLENRFNGFGTYEDAIVSDGFLLNHSLLSPLLNCGLLQPDLVLSNVMAYAGKNDIPLNDLEGFIRQLMGWREFVYTVYRREGRKQRAGNFFQFDHSMPNAFYTATTGVKPVDDAIIKVLKTGYNHHIERLMILSNFMLLCEINPNDVYKWFMELYIDAYDWVMVPNVYGMGQFADGGLMCTKPYISGSNYVLKMSDYKKDETWTKIWDSLFWRFMHIHRGKLLKNPRVGMLISSFDNRPDDEKKKLLDFANRYLEKLHSSQLVISTQ
jgi:deoxyribodipyrimidine photolyase-related protein